MDYGVDTLVISLLYSDDTCCISFFALVVNPSSVLAFSVGSQYPHNIKISGNHSVNYNNPCNAILIRLSSLSIIGHLDTCDTLVTPGYEPL